MKPRTLNFRFQVFAAMLPAFALLSGCAATFDPPPGYVRVTHQHRHDLKFVSAAGNVVAVKSRPNEDSKADLAFWSAAVERQKTQFDGMRLTARDPVRSDAGVGGVLFQFESGDGPARLQYWVALFVTESRIITFEAGGAADKIGPEAAAIRRAALTVH